MRFAVEQLYAILLPHVSSTIYGEKRSCLFALSLTDSHYHPRAEKDYGAPKMLTRSREILEAIPDAVNALKPDFVVHAGDLLCGGLPLPTHLYERSVDEVADMLASTRLPFTVPETTTRCADRLYGGLRSPL